MAKQDVINIEAKKVGQIDLADVVFASEVKKALLHEAVVASMANRRRGTACTKNRAEVKASGVKPYRQKGTGRARHGSWVSPLFVGGGITFGPKPRDYSLKMSRKKRNAALRSALSVKVKENKFVVVDKWVPKQKTKEMAGILKTMGICNALIVLESPTDWLERVVRNIPNIDVIYVNQLNAYSIIARDFLVCTTEVVAKINERLEQ